MPGLGLLAQFLLPGLLVYLFYGVITTTAIMPVVASVMLVAGAFSLVSGNMDLLVWLSQSAGLTMVLIMGVRKELSGPSTLVIGLSVQIVIFFLVLLLLLDASNPLHGYQLILQDLGNDLDQSLALYKERSSSPPPPEMDIWFMEFKEFTLRFFPGIMGLVFSMTALSNLLFVRRLVAVKKNEVIFSPSFQLWRLPENLVWFAIGFAFLAMFGEGGLKIFGENLLMMVGGLYFVQGLSITNFHFERLNIHPVARGIIYMLISIQWYGLLGVALLGLLNTWWNLRPKDEVRDI